MAKPQSRSSRAYCISAKRDRAACRAWNSPVEVRLRALSEVRCRGLRRAVHNFSHRSVTVAAVISQ